MGKEAYFYGKRGLLRLAYSTPENGLSIQPTGTFGKGGIHTRSAARLCAGGEEEEEVVEEGLGFRV